MRLENPRVYGPPLRPRRSRLPTADISSAVPRPRTPVSVIGFGCWDRDRPWLDNRKRKLDYAMGPTSEICGEYDRGAPRFFGHGSSGALWGVSGWYGADGRDINGHV